MDDKDISVLHDLYGKFERTSATNIAEHQSFVRRLTELESSSKRQNDILLALQRQGDAIESMNCKIDRVAKSVERIDIRVDSIEKEPADKWKKMAFEVIKCIVLAAAGVIAGYFFK